MVFDPETAYREDWQYRDRIKDVTWEVPGNPTPTITTGLKARFGLIDTPDLVSVAASLGLSTDAAAVVVWEPKPVDIAIADWASMFAPQPGHVLRREDSGAGFLVMSAAQSALSGKWLILVEREVVNA